MKKRILVCGGRDYTNQSHVNKTLSQCLPWFDFDFLLIHGSARGADRCAHIWAFFQGCPVIEMKANWDYFGRKAGSKRNQWMIDYAKPDLVIAFPGGAGTADMVRRAKENQIDVYEVVDA